MFQKQSQKIHSKKEKIITYAQYKVFNGIQLQGKWTLYFNIPGYNNIWIWYLSKEATFIWRHELWEGIVHQNPKFCVCVLGSDFIFSSVSPKGKT